LPRLEIRRGRLLLGVRAPVGGIRGGGHATADPAPPMSSCRHPPPCAARGRGRADRRPPRAAGGRPRAATRATPIELSLCAETRAHDAMGAMARRLWDTQTTSLRHFDGNDGSKVLDLLGDVAADLAANLDAYETGIHPGALGGAERMAMTLRDRLEDREAVGFFDAPESQGVEPGRLARRERPIEENALAADGLLRLAVLTGN